jgi:pyruvate kinase
MTKIITTLGPSSENIEILKFFWEHKVEIARLNYSHNTVEWHLKTAQKAREIGLKLMVDLDGPKVLLGDIERETEIINGNIVVLEKQIPGKIYPIWEEIEGENLMVLPSYFDLTKFLKVDKTVLIDDGKLELRSQKISGKKVFCKVIFGGNLKSHKGINLPDTDLKIDFLVERDKAMLKASLKEMKPEYIAPSFVKTMEDLNLLEEFLESILGYKKPNKMNLEGVYFPKICTKLEMAEVMEDQNLMQIIDYSDMLMIARGDLALETFPLHITVPKLQDKIAKLCQQKNKPFVVATQILESMTNSPVPTRAEMSDLYRAVHLNKADFVMLSAESAAGKFPIKCVQLMENMINLETV